MNISITDARALFTNMLIDVYRERPMPTAFLRSFFPNVESATKEISIEVQRGTEKVAVDVMRGSEGNRNSFSKSTLKTIVPPYFREYFDATDLDLYDRLFGSAVGEVSAAIFAAFVDSAAEKMQMLMDKIERAYELQCAQVLETGIVTVRAGLNIDYKRKSASLVDLGAGNYFANAGHDVFADFANGIAFLREKGKAQGGVYNAILGGTALSDLYGNSKFIERQNLVNMQLDAVRAPQRNAVGASYHGQISAGSYKVGIWSYPEVYDNASNVSTPYINPKKMIMLPEAPRFKMAFAAVPRLLKEGAPAIKGAYVFGEYLDERNSAHIMDVKSAGVAVPVAVDQIYTAQVVA